MDRCHHEHQGGQKDQRDPDETQHNTVSYNWNCGQMAKHL